MASNTPIAKPADGTPSRLPLILIAVIVVLGTAFFGYLEFGPRPAVQDVPLSEEAKGYVKNLALADVKMTARLNYFSQKVVEIAGSIGNNGPRELEVVEVTCLFRDYAGQVVLRQRVAIVSQKMGGLKPGEMKTFRLPFDALPANWDQQMPQLVIAGITFA